MNVKNGCKDLKRYPQISRRVRDPLARLFIYFKKKCTVQVFGLKFRILKKIYSCHSPTAAQDCALLADWPRMKEG